MKKLISLTVAVAMTLSMAACGSKTTETTAAATGTTATEAAETQAASETSETAGDAYTLVLVHGNNIGTPNDNWANYFKEAVESKSNGRITVEVYPANQMGSERELTEGVQVGTYDIQVTGLISSLSFIPALATLNMPFLFNGMSAEQIDQVLNQGDYYDLMQQEYAKSQDLRFVLLKMHTA